MAGVHMQFNITDTGVKQLFTRMSNADFSLMNAEMGEALVSEVLERFDSGQAPDGTAWEVSARAWEQGGKTGIDTSTLLRSIHSESNNDGFDIGSSEVYAAAYHFGMDEKKTVAVDAHTRLIKSAFGKPLPFGVYQSVSSHSREQYLHSPARPIFGLEASQQERLEEVWLGWLDEDALK